MKRWFDIVFSLLAIVIAIPVFALVAILIRLIMGKPVIFKQTRSGRCGQPFEIVKFRTMNNDQDQKGKVLPDALRLTVLGKFIRSTSLDELPQMWNVLWGDMSIVGPRPLLPEYLQLYSKRQARRHEVKPGITGWAQVNGRNLPEWETRLEMDVWYVEHQSLVLDCRIILKTIVKVFAWSGVSAKRQATVEPFRGTPKK